MTGQFLNWMKWKVTLFIYVFNKLLKIKNVFN